MADGRLDSFSGFCANTDDLKTGLVDLLGQLIDGRVGGRAHQDGSAVLLDQLVDDGRRSHGLASSGWTLKNEDKSVVPGGLFH